MPDTYSLENDAPARRVITVAGLMLVFIPILQGTAQLWPLQVGNIQWRMAAATVLSGLGLLPYLGFGLIGAGARFGGRRLVERVIGWIAVVSVVILVASLGLFVLDALQMKTIVASRAMDGFRQNNIRVVTVMLSLTVAYGLLAMALLKGSPSRSTVSRSTAKVSDDRIGLIVGQS